MSKIETVDLTKNYGNLCAINKLNILCDNEIYGLLGPNGSGKTTTIRMLTTLLNPTSGSASVCGYDVMDNAAKVRNCISYVPQDMAVDIRLTGRENVTFFAKLYGIRNRAERQRRVDNAISVMDLSDRADDMTKTYSGGMRRRLELAQALVHEPEVLFLDEPTIGLDVAARRSIWEHIFSLRKSGMTVLVTTHQMDEAERYCDRVGILKKGVIVREGRPVQLKSDLMKDVIIIRANGGIPSTLPDGLTFIGDGDLEGEYIFTANHGSEVLPNLLRIFETEGVKVLSSFIREPTLEDVYMQSCGNGTEDLGSFDDRQFRNLMVRR
jgi:ABC-2 type transport system ATP-binding protein